MGERVGSKVALMARNKSALSLLILALIVGGISASATGLLNTASGGYLVCVDTKTNSPISHHTCMVTWNVARERISNTG